MSGAWAYPFLGIKHVVTHPQLYKAIMPIISKAALASIGITAGMFFFTYIPHLAFCVLFSGPLAFIPATVMVLFESWIIVNWVTRTVFLGAGQDRICKFKDIRMDSSYVFLNVMHSRRRSAATRE